MTKNGNFEELLKSNNHCHQSNLQVLITEVFKTRSSRPEVFYNKGVLRNFVKFIGNHMCKSTYI